MDIASEDQILFSVEKVETLPETLVPGRVYFIDSEGTIYIATSETEYKGYSGVTDIEYKDNILTVKKANQDPITIDFSELDNGIKDLEGKLTWLEIEGTITNPVKNQFIRWNRPGYSDLNNYLNPENYNEETGFIGNIHKDCLIFLNDNNLLNNGVSYSLPREYYDNPEYNGVTLTKIHNSSALKPGDVCSNYLSLGRFDTRYDGYWNTYISHTTRYSSDHLHDPIFIQEHIINSGESPQIETSAIITDKNKEHTLFDLYLNSSWYIVKSSESNNIDYRFVWTGYYNFKNHYVTTVSGKYYGKFNGDSIIFINDSSLLWTANRFYCLPKALFQKKSYLDSQGNNISPLNTGEGEFGQVAYEEVIKGYGPKPNSMILYSGQIQVTGRYDYVTYSLGFDRSNKKIILKKVQKQTKELVAEEDWESFPLMLESSFTDSAVINKKLESIPTGKNEVITTEDTIAQALSNLQTQITTINSAVQPSNSLPLVALGSGSIGTSTNYAREDHVHPVQTSVSGNAGTATKLETARTISLTGEVSGSTTFDGSDNASISTTIESVDASKITSGTISIDRLPKGALERLVVVANETARFALTTDDVQEGDTVKQSDTGVMYYVVNKNELNNESGYIVYTAGAATSVPWSGVTDRPTKLSDFTNDSGFATTAQLGNYLPLTGGTLTGRLIINSSHVTDGQIRINMHNARYGMVIDNTYDESFTESKENLIYFYLNGERKGLVGYNEDYGVCLYQSNGFHRFNFNNGIAYVNGQPVITNYLLHEYLVQSTNEWNILPQARNTSGILINYKSNDSANPLNTPVNTFTFCKGTKDPSDQADVYANSFKTKGGTSNHLVCGDGSLIELSTVSKVLKSSLLGSGTVNAGYIYNHTGTVTTITTLSDFGESNPDAVIVSQVKLTFNTAQDIIKVDGLDDLSGSYYIYCLSWMPNGKIAVNGAVYS